MVEDRVAARPARLTPSATRRIRLTTMSWDDARYLEVLARAQTPSAAARELGVSTATVYRRLAALEEEVGAACMVRGSKPVKLTEIGQELAAAAAGFASDFNRVKTLAVENETSVSGRVGLTTVGGFLPFLIEPLRGLREAHPELTVDVHLGDSGPSVWRREIEVAIGIMPNPTEGLIGRRLRSIQYGVFGTSAACARSELQWVVFSASKRHLAEAEWEREHAKPAIVSTGSRNAIVEFARAGLGVALLPRRLGAAHGLVEREEYRDRLAPLTRQVWLLSHPGVRNARVRALSNSLYDALS